MRKRIAHGLALVLCVAGLGAAQGNSGSDHDRISPLKQKPKPATKSTHAKRARPYQVGTASWYGSYFEGKETASGEPFDMYDLTAAHPTLPLGSFLNFIDLRAGNSVLDHVSHPGRLHERRIIELPDQAASCFHQEH